MAFPWGGWAFARAVGFPRLPEIGFKKLFFLLERTRIAIGVPALCAEAEKSYISYRWPLGNYLWLGTIELLQRVRTIVHSLWRAGAGRSEKRNALSLSFAVDRIGGNKLAAAIVLHPAIPDLIGYAQGYTIPHDTTPPPTAASYGLHAQTIGSLRVREKPAPLPHRQRNSWSRFGLRWSSICLPPIAPRVMKGHRGGRVAGWTRSFVTQTVRSVIFPLSNQRRCRERRG